MLKRIIKKISLALLATVAGLLILELVLRQFFPIYIPVMPEAYEYDPELVVRLRPDAHLFQTTDFQQETVVNKLGTANFQESFDGYASLVFALGDSYTQGTAVPADMSYPAQLDLLLNQDTQGFYAKRFGVVNLGVAGFGGEQELINLRRWTQQLRPPASILYLGCDNDFIDDLAFKDAMLRGNPPRQGMSALLQPLLARSQIGVRLGVLMWWRARRQLIQEMLARRGNSGSMAELQSSVLDRLAAYAQEHGALLVVSWSDDGASYSWLKAWAAGRGIAFADWAPKANSVRAAVPALPLDNQHSGGHHRGWTNRIIAEEFFRQLRAHGL